MADGAPQPPGIETRARTFKPKSDPTDRRIGRWLAIAAGASIVVVGALALAFLLSKAGASYRVQAAFHRDGPGGDEILPAGGRIAPDDLLALEIDLSRRAFVYILSEGDRGTGLYLLFPLHLYDIANPLEPGRHRLPPRLRGGLGPRSGWRPTSPDGRERVAIVASPHPILILEDVARRPAEVVEVGPAAAAAWLDGPTLRRLRASGGLTGVEARSTRGSSGGAEGLVPSARELGAEAEEARGVWIRAADFQVAGTK